MLAVLFVAVTSWADPQTLIGARQGKGIYMALSLVQLKFADRVAVC